MDHKVIAMALVKSYMSRKQDFGTDPEELAKKTGKLVAAVESYISDSLASDTAVSLAMTIIEMNKMKFSDMGSNYLDVEIGGVYTNLFAA